jgi:hypothetical protein
MSDGGTSDLILTDGSSAISSLRSILPDHLVFRLKEKKTSITDSHLFTSGICRSYVPTDIKIPSHTHVEALIQRAHKSILGKDGTPTDEEPTPHERSFPLRTKLAGNGESLDLK